MRLKDLKIGAEVLGTIVYKIEDNTCYLKCKDCGKTFVYKWDKIKCRKRNFCECNYDYYAYVNENLTGEIFGDLKVIEINKERTYALNNENKKYKTLWDCECTKCKTKTVLSSDALIQLKRRNGSGCTTCFGDWVLGKRYGRLTPIEYIGRDGNKKNWLCKCDCGNKVILNESSFKSENTNSCGCIHSETLSKRNSETAKYNGESNGEDGRILNIYGAMRDRCYNTNNKKYSDYGGRGINICQEWIDDYFKFKEWSLSNGYNDTLTIDRIDVNGNYEPNNCRWATMKVQANNKRNNKYITYQGRTQTLSQWCEELDLDYFRTKARFNTCHLTPEQAFTLPKQTLRRKLVN